MLTAFDDVVVGEFYAHLHHDSFITLLSPNNSVLIGASMCAPSVQPTYNPSFRLYSFSPEDLLVSKGLHPVSPHGEVEIASHLSKRGFVCGGLLDSSCLSHLDVSLLTSAVGCRLPAILRQLGICKPCWWFELQCRIPAKWGLWLPLLGVLWVVRFALGVLLCQWACCLTALKVNLDAQAHASKRTCSRVQNCFTVQQIQNRQCSIRRYWRPLSMRSSMLQPIETLQPCPLISHWRNVGVSSSETCSCRAAPLPSKTL